MASPLGHSLVGIGLAAAVSQAMDAPASPALWLGAVIASCAPDLDLIGLAFGLGLERVHRRATHSLFVLGVLTLVATWAWAHLLGGVRLGLVLAWSAALLSHPILDVLTTGPRTAAAGFGIPLLWPVLSQRWSVRRVIVRSPPITASLVSGKTWHALLPELCFFGSASVALIVLGHLL